VCRRDDRVWRGDPGVWRGDVISRQQLALLAPTQLYSQQCRDGAVCWRDVGQLVRVRVALRTSHVGEVVDEFHHRIGLVLFGLLPFSVCAFDMEMLSLRSWHLRG
jgi:hypothetical protein